MAIFQTNPLQEAEPETKAKVGQIRLLENIFVI